MKDWKVEDISSKVISPAARYVMGRRAGPFLFLAGQIAAIPQEQRIIMGYQDLPKEIAAKLRTGSMNTDFKEGPLVSQAWFIWNNIQKLLEEGRVTAIEWTFEPDRVFCPHLDKLTGRIRKPPA